MPVFGDAAGEPAENGEKPSEVQREIFRRFERFFEDASKTDRMLKEKTQDILH